MKKFFEEPSIELIKLVELEKIADDSVDILDPSFGEGVEDDF